jgi:hypothetical protein
MNDLSPREQRAVGLLTRELLTARMAADRDISPSLVLAIKAIAVAYVREFPAQ